MEYIFYAAQSSFSKSQIDDLCRIVEDIEAAEKEGKVEKIRDIPEKGRSNWRATLPGGACVFIKRQTVGNTAKWSGRSRRKHPFEQEAEDYMKLTGNNRLEVPLPLFAAFDPDRYRPESVFMVSKGLEGYTPLVLLLENQRSKRTVLPLQLTEEFPVIMARFLVDLHEMGFYYRELHGRHVFLKEENGVWKWALVDLEGSIFRKPLQRYHKIRNLYRAERYILKNYSPEARRKFLEEYCKLAYPGENSSGFVSDVLRYISLKEKNSALTAKSHKTLPARLHLFLRRCQSILLRIKLARH